MSRLYFWLKSPDFIGSSKCRSVAVSAMIHYSLNILLGGMDDNILFDVVHFLSCVAVVNLVGWHQNWLGLLFHVGSRLVFRPFTAVYGIFSPAFI